MADGRHRPPPPPPTPKHPFPLRLWSEPVLEAHGRRGKRERITEGGDRVSGGVETARRPFVDHGQSRRAAPADGAHPVYCLRGRRRGPSLGRIHELARPGGAGTREGTWGDSKLGERNICRLSRGADAFWLFWPLRFCAEGLDGPFAAANSAKAQASQRNANLIRPVWMSPCIIWLRQRVLFAHAGHGFLELALASVV